MLDVLTFLAPPFVACLILVAILGYLGLHVLERKVIFVDLALAQIAGTGTVIAFALGHEPRSGLAFAFSLGAAALGAAFFAWTRSRRERVPHEAIIGITYVIASAATIVIADRAPEGAEHLKELLAGAVLWVTWGTVVKDLLICAAVGAFHFALRRPFVLISENPEEAFRRGMKVRAWDFLFYLSFGLVITVSVEIGGVLMVFAYLVGPAIIALAVSPDWRVRLGVAWGVGTLASALGLLASYRWDFPAGPSVVCALGALLAVFALGRVRQNGLGA